jgi:hypothetical protein
MTIRTPHQHLVEFRIEELRPTQMTVGLAEVRAKRAEWRRLKRKEREQRLQTHWFPCVLGAKSRPYIVDHHHLGLALREEGVERCFGVVLADLSWLEPLVFWRTMEFHQWAHPFDAQGLRCPAAEIPTRLQRLADDPYRSLVGFVRNAGGFSKDAAPYAEFLWADYFRPRLEQAFVVAEPAAALTAALLMAGARDARYLPGWTGTSGAIDARGREAVTPGTAA